MTSNAFVHYGVHLHLLELTWTLHCDRDFWYPSRIFYVWRYCIAWLSGDFIEILRTGFTGNSFDVEQNFLLSIMFRDAGTLFWLNGVLLENEHEVSGSLVNQKNIVQSICNHLLRS